MVFNWYKWDKKNTFLSFLIVPVMIILPTVNALIPKLLIDAINNHAALRQFIWMVAAVSLVAALLGWLRPALVEKSLALLRNAGMRYAVLTFEKLLHMDYANLESYDGRLKLERCKKFALGGDTAPGGMLIWSATGFCTSLLGMGAYTMLLTRVNPLLLLLIIGMSALEFLCHQALRRAELRMEDRVAPFGLRLEYFFRLATAPKPAKDIRLTGAKDWLLFSMAQSVAGYGKVTRWFMGQTVKTSALQALCALVREAAAFGFLIAAVLRDKTTVADFLFHFGLVTGFSAWVSGISWQLVHMRQVAAECQKFRDFLEIPDQKEKSSAPAAFGAIERIAFCGVFFSYEEEENGENALEEINFTVRAGEKIAVVGENGAGKTTLVKLLCGLYAPTRGKILVNGADAATLERESYFDLFSAVFQDYTFLPTSVAANILLREEERDDREKLEWALRQAGLWEKIQSLEEGLQAKLIKQMNAEAVDFSGGEKQRLLLARALCKNAPVLILDEPAAALDPIAEERLYAQYRALMQGKTAFYISHRLSSTQFCDRIFFLQGGRIAEVGTHEELLALQGGYWRMFQTQAYYYQKTGSGAREAGDGMPYAAQGVTSV
jgi:ATP-binding cassette subfamily B protein